MPLRALLAKQFRPHLVLPLRTVAFRESTRQPTKDKDYCLIMPHNVLHHSRYLVLQQEIATQTSQLANAVKAVAVVHHVGESVIQHLIDGYISRPHDEHGAARREDGNANGGRGEPCETALRQKAKARLQADLNKPLDDSTQLNPDELLSAAPSTNDPEALMRAYRQYAPLPRASTERNESPPARWNRGFNLPYPRSRFKESAWRSWHLSSCAKCNPKMDRGPVPVSFGLSDQSRTEGRSGKPQREAGVTPDAHETIDTDPCYFPDLLEYIKHGFVAPLDPNREQTPPIVTRQMPPATEAHADLLRDLSKEKEWQARVRLNDTPYKADQIFIASSFIAEKKVFSHIFHREPRVVGGFHRTINLITPTIKMRLPTLADILRETRPGDKIATLDLSSAFLQVPLAAESMRYFGIHSCSGDVSEAELYAKLPFGYKLSPLIFSILTAEAVKICRHKGMRVFAYYDDFILLASEEEAEKHFQFLKQLLSELGWVFKDSKTQKPSHRAKVLGIWIDTQRQVITIASEVVQRLQQMLEESYRRAPTLAEIRSIVGTAAYVAFVIPGARARMAGLYKAQAITQKIIERRLASRATGDQPSINKGKPLSRFVHPLIIEHVQWWRQRCTQVTSGLGAAEVATSTTGTTKDATMGDRSQSELSSRLWLALPETMISSDASLDGSAAAFDSANVYLVARNNCERRAKVLCHLFDSSTAAEILAGFLPILCNPKAFAGKLVWVRTDSAAAAFAINKMSSQTAPNLFSLIGSLQEEFRFIVTARWVPREENVIADTLSHCNSHKSIAAAVSSLSQAL